MKSSFRFNVVCVGRIVPVVLVSALAIAMSACSSNNPADPAPIATAPSLTLTGAPVSAAITQTNGSSVGTSTVSMCSGAAGLQSVFGFTPAALPRFDISVFAMQAVTLSRVTLQLIDGTHLGTPITFPQSALGANTAIVAGASRTFTLQPQFACSTARPTSIAGDLAFFTAAGSTFATHVAAPLP